MGHEVRRVPADWRHPKNDKGYYVPLFDGAKFAQRLAGYDEESRKWIEGFCLDCMGDWAPLTGKQKGRPYSLWGGDRPNPKNYMPLWNDKERTHFMMYENASEGTPISPVFTTAEDLARWLEYNKVSWFGDRSASYGIWMSIINDSINHVSVLSQVACV